jgi:hypothetical protein
LPLAKDTLASGLARSLLDLQLLDAFVYCSIEAYLKESKANDSLFANRDAKSFMQPSVLDDLQKLGCKVIPGFRDALAFIEKQLAKGMIP